MKKNTALLTIGLLMVSGVCLLTSCENAKPPIKSYESYLFASHDVATGEWTIIRTDDVDHTKTKIVAECESYKMVDKEANRDKDACSYVVGAKLVPNRFPEKSIDFLDVWYQPESITINQFGGKDRIMQSYKIKSATVMP
jgi:hypothetical protein